MLKRTVCFLVAALFVITVWGQNKPASGILSGNVTDERKKPLEGATSEIILLADSLKKQSALTDKEGSFSFKDIADGYSGFV